MLEFFDVINPDGTSAGYSLPRDEVHKKGLWHRTVHIWILNFNKELLIQSAPFRKKYIRDCGTYLRVISPAEKTVAQVQFAN